MLVFWVHRGIKGQKTVQNDKKFCLSCSISQEPYIIWLSFMVHMCRTITSPDAFFNFKISLFWIVRGLNRQKMAQNDRNLSVRHISYDLHLWYTCMYKRIVSPGIFFIFFFFKILNFRIIRRGGLVKGQKMASKWQKKSVCLTLYLRNHTSYDGDFWYTCAKWWYLQQVFFIFQNFGFWVF